VNALARLLEHPGIWRGRSLSRIDTLSSGFPELDARLAGGGWPKVGLVEILATHLGSGELRLLLPLLAAVSQQPQARWCTWIAPPLSPYAPALAARGVNLSRILVVRAPVRMPKGPEWAPEWATEQALISGACDVVLTWITQPLKPRIVRRLQLATQRGRTLAFLLRPWSARVAREPSHALLRLGVEPQSNGNSSGVRLSILKSRGGATGEWWLDLDAAQAAAGV
jgi:protein ImuA